MKKALFLLILIIVSINGLHAKNVKGFIKFADSMQEVTLKIPAGLFGNHPQYIRLQNKIKYISPNGDVKVLKPSDAEAVKFSFKGEMITLVSVKNNTDQSRLTGVTQDSHIFLKLVMDGKLKLFQYYSAQYSPGVGQQPGTTTIKDEYLLQLPDEPLKRLKSIGFRKDMKEYFSDCPALVEILDSRTLRKKDMEAIVEFYNQNCN
ncbi:hypothetical protein [Fulvivirga sediminis]|uniref:Uncharacterized protein n=1 Tax=Fulvivirga sediminis TaxID=2803949 RepID=A0A937K1W4_9BACT|nr:hypothetical protein [Fulvivirga sediminis]MBL3657911.1 hypothetical protein [Fulvivirga sediminis]